MRKGNRKPLTPDDPMPWGEFRGTPMKDVPPEHLIHLAEQPWLRDWPTLFNYISDRIHDLKAKVDDGRKKDPRVDRTPETYQDFIDNK